MVNYITGTLQGDMLQWMKQWVNLKEGKKIKQREWFEDDKFTWFDNILTDFIKIVKENLYGFTDDKTQEIKILYTLSKIEL